MNGNGNLERMKTLDYVGRSVLRIGANAVDRSSWQGAVDGLTPIMPAQIDALAAFA